jgi:hypothetical protein
VIFPSREFDQTLSALCDGAGTAEQVEELAAVLRENPAARDAYLVSVELHARLASESELFASLGSTSSLRMTQTLSIDDPRIDAATVQPATARLGLWQRQMTGRHWIAPLGAIAAAVILGVGLWWFLALHGPQRTLVVNPVQAGGVRVRVLDVQGADSSHWQTGQVATVDGMDLESGSIRFRVERSGVEVSVSGPASLKLADPMHLKLRRGQVTADAAAAQKGFAIETDSARVVDLGTKFGVVASADGNTDVVVFEGEVELYERNGARTNKLANLLEGEAMQVGGRRKARAVWNVLSDGLDNSWALNANDLSGAAGIAARDNVQNKGPGHFYHIIRHGMSSGVKAFSNMREQAVHPRWTATDGGFPSWLTGADIVRTRHLKQYRPDFQLTLSIDHPASVFVMRDSHTPPPSWLQGQFTDTGTTVLLGPIGPGMTDDTAFAGTRHAGHFLPCSVWRRDVEQPGDVVLGPPVEGGGSDALMYGVAVQSLIDE